jgi:uncharacterized membrane protein YczE
MKVFDKKSRNEMLTLLFALVTTGLGSWLLLYEIREYVMDLFNGEYIWVIGLILVTLGTSAYVKSKFNKIKG